MTVSLDGNLQTALDGIDHRPICKIITKSPKNTDFPFAGNYFNQDATEEYRPAMIVHSTGRLANAYRKGGTGAGDLYFAYSDVERISWAHVKIYEGSGAGNWVTNGQAIIELASGNFGIVFICTESSTSYLKSMVISPTGTVISAATNIATSNTGTSYWVWPTLEAITGGFLCVVKKYTVSGPVYELVKRTCDTDFANWTGESALSISGISSTYDTNTPELIRSAAGTLYLYFSWVDDYTSATQFISNIYVSISTDDGVTWGAAAQVTSYTDQGTRAIHPSAAIKTGGDMFVSWQDVKDVLFIRDNTTGFCGSANYETMGMHFDEISRTLFVTKGNTDLGTKNVTCILAIDVDTWTIEECYNSSSSSPKFSTIYANNHVWWREDYAWSGYNGIAMQYQYWTALINNQTQTITQYNFANSATYSLTKNVDWDWYAQYSWPIALNFDGTCLDTINDRLWMIARDTYSIHQYTEVGYIDITEQPDPITGFYTWHNLFFKYQNGPLYHWITPSNGGFKVFPNESKILCAGTQSVSSIRGRCRIYNLETGSEMKNYYEETNSGFPYRGIMHAIIHENKIYASFPYESSYGQEERRGLCIIDMTDDSVRYKRPSFSTRNDYGLTGLILIDGDTANPRILMDCLDGNCIFDINSETWTLFNADNVPGWESGGIFMAYDPVNNTIFNSYKNVQAYREDGSFSNHFKYDGAYQGTASNFTYSNLQQLTTYSEASEGDMALDEDDVLWFSWVYDDQDLGPSLMWDRTDFSPEIHNFLLAGTPVKIDWEVEKVAKASFTLARGDLFDPTNLTSIYAPTVIKGRMVDIYKGENVGGQDYYQLQGEFFIVGSRTRFDKNGHPQITIECEDLSTFWNEFVVTATAGYRNTSMSDILSDLLEDALSLTSNDYVVPTFDNLHGLYTQWVDVSMEDIMADIDTHFGCFRHWGVDRKLRFLQIDLSGSADHTYSDLTHIFNYAPADKYASFINAVVVKCEGITPFEVLWDEESITQIDGTLGFWSKQKKIRVYYNEDHTRMVRHPRLDVIQSIKDFSPLMEFLGADADEYISYEDPDETFCDIKIEGPDRAVYVFAFAATTLALGVAATSCDYGRFCGVMIMLTNLSLSALIQVLSAVANYRYGVHGRPIGHELETYQGRWDDSAFQTFIGGIEITNEFDDPLSYTVAHCVMVANQEGDILVAQRNRVNFEKTAHLQDELGDIIQIQHPISLQTMKLFIAKLTRVFVRPKASSKAGGKFTDTIDGWRVT